MWVVLALIAAAGTAAREALLKSVMRSGDAVPLALLVSAIAAGLLAPPALRAAPPGPGFWPALLVSGSINALAAVMIARAVHASDLSLGSPLQSTTPLFMVPVGWILLGELPRPSGICGIALIVAGAWLLNLPERTQGLLAPFRAALAEPGPRLFLGVAAIYAVSGTVDKVGVAASSPLLWATALHATAALLLLAYLTLRGRLASAGALLRRAPVRIVAGGTVMAIAAYAQMSALPLTLAAHVIAVKRVSVLLSVVAGGVLFRERRLGRRLAAAAVMLAGFVLLTFG